MTIFQTDLEDLVPELDDILAAQGAPEGRLKKMYSDEVVEMIGVGTWPSSSSTKGRTSLVCKIRGWKLLGDETFRTDGLVGMFNVQKRDHDSDAFEREKRTHTGEEGATFQLRGYLSHTGDRVLVESVEFVDLSGEVTANVDPIDHDRFGTFLFSSSGQSYVCDFRDGEYVTKLELLTQHSEFETEVEKVQQAYDQIEQVTNWLVAQKRTKHNADETQLAILKLDRDLFSCVFRYVGHSKIEFVTVYVPWQDGSLGKPEIMDVSKHYGS